MKLFYYHSDICISWHWSNLHFPDAVLFSYTSPGATRWQHPTHSLSTSALEHEPDFQMAAASLCVWALLPLDPTLTLAQQTIHAIEVTPPPYTLRQNWQGWCLRTPALSPIRWDNSDMCFLLVSRSVSSETGLQWSLLAAGWIM